jgi:hypothetical protein
MEKQPLRLYQVAFQPLMGGEEQSAMFIGHSFADAEKQFYAKYKNFGILFITFGGIIE